MSIQLYNNHPDSTMATMATSALPPSESPPVSPPLSLAKGEGEDRHAAATAPEPAEAAEAAPTEAQKYTAEEAQDDALGIRRGWMPNPRIHQDCSGGIAVARSSHKGAKPLCRCSKNDLEAKNDLDGNPSIQKKSGKSGTSHGSNSFMKSKDPRRTTALPAETKAELFDPADTKA